jgi:hypothetical protein
VYAVVQLQAGRVSVSDACTVSASIIAFMYAAACETCIYVWCVAYIYTRVSESICMHFVMAFHHVFVVHVVVVLVLVNVRMCSMSTWRHTRTHRLGNGM